MRRVIMALIATAVGTSVLVGLKAQSVSALLGYSAEAPVDPAAAAGPSGSGEGIQAGETPPGSKPGTTPGVPPAAPGGTTTTPDPGPPGPTTSTKKPTATKTTKAPPASRTITGTAYAAKDFGDMRVKIVVTGTHIDDIVTIQQSNRPKTVATTLRTQALSAQSANVGNVSGATYSSDAWKQSLQSAINQI